MRKLIKINKQNDANRTRTVNRKQDILTSLMSVILPVVDRINLSFNFELGTYVWNDAEIGKLSNEASYFKWDDGEPNDKLYEVRRLGKPCSGEDCVRLYHWNNTAEWYDTECSQRLPYVCEKTRGKHFEIFSENVKIFSNFKKRCQ